jgi:DNA-binding HxlR family transcriptional regulator
MNEGNPNMADPIFHAWTGRVLFALSRGPLRFNALARALDVPSPRMLNKLLRQLTRDGITVRTVHRVEPPGNVEYSLTELGRELAASTSSLLGFWKIHESEIKQRRFLHEEAHRADAIRAEDANA